MKKDEVYKCEKCEKTVDYICHKVIIIDGNPAKMTEEEYYNIKRETHYLCDSCFKLLEKKIRDNNEN